MLTEKEQIDALQQYLLTAMWSSCDENGVSFDEMDVRCTDRVKQNSLEDILYFYQLAEKYLEDIPIDQWAHDFWLTRNHHGAGFWDRGLGEIGKFLTDLSCSFGTVDLYLTDEGEVDL